MGAWLAPCKHAAPPRMLPNFVALCQTYWVQVRVPTNLGDAKALHRWDVEVADPWNVLLFRLCYLAKFGRNRSNHLTVIMELCQKYSTPRPTHSRSLKDIGTDTDRSATWSRRLRFISETVGPWLLRNFYRKSLVPEWFLSLSLTFSMYFWMFR